MIEAILQILQGLVLIFLVGLIALSALTVSGLILVFSMSTIDRIRRGRCTLVVRPTVCKEGDWLNASLSVEKKKLLGKSVQFELVLYVYVGTESGYRRDGVHASETSTIELPDLRAESHLQIPIGANPAGGHYWVIEATVTGLDGSPLSRDVNIADREGKLPANQLIPGKDPFDRKAYSAPT